MEKSAESAPTNTIPLESTILEHKTPQLIKQSSPNSAVDSRKSCTPDRLKVPKALKYTERYTSPTDHIMSPVSKGLLARTRKAPRLLPPNSTPPDSRFKVAGGGSFSNVTKLIKQQ